MRQWTAASALAAGLLLSGAARAQLLPTPPVVPAVPITSRAPTFTDDSTAGYAPGSTWLFGGTVYVNQVATPGAAQWLPTPNPVLPLDAIGLRLNTVAVAGAGTGYAVGEVVTAAGVAAGTTITSLGSGTGAAGTYNLSTTPGTIASEAVSAATGLGVDNPYVENGTNFVVAQ